MGHINEPCMRVHHKFANRRMRTLVVPKIAAIVGCLVVNVIGTVMQCAWQFEIQTSRHRNSTENKAHR